MTERKASWAMMGDDSDWVVHFTHQNGDHAGTYHSNDFQDVLARHVAWVNDGDLPEDVAGENTDSTRVQY